MPFFYAQNVVTKSENFLKKCLTNNVAYGRMRAQIQKENSKGDTKNGKKT